jgi:FtsH-binding integral membrane protein
LNEKGYFKENKLKSLIFCTALTGFLFWSSTNVEMLYHSVFNMIFSILLLLFITGINVWSAVLIEFIFIIIILVTEMSVGVVEMMIFHTSMDQLVANPQQLMIFTVVTKILQIAVILLLYRFNLSLRKFKIFQKESSIYSNFIFSIGVFGMFTFGITAIIFAAFALFGYLTKLDLSRLRTILFMGLIALILASILSIFFTSQSFNLALILLGIIFFIGYIAYDIHIIKRKMLMITDPDKLAIYGALQLYIDFINIFIRLLSLFGGRKK